MGLLIKFIENGLGMFKWYSDDMFAITRNTDITLFLNVKIYYGV